MTSGGARILTLLARILTLLFLALWIRLFHLQVFAHPEADRRLERLVTKVERDVARRGRVVSRHGYVLAESVPALDLYADSRWLPADRGALLELLDELLPGHREELGARLGRPGYTRLLRRPLADGDAIGRLRAAKRSGLLPGIELEATTIRRYPEGPLAAHVLGYIDAEGRGRAGVERALDAFLRGRRGSLKVYRADAGRRPLFDPDVRNRIGTPGADVTLTLDVALQYFAEEALDRVVEESDPAWASIVVLDPATADVLAMANRPTFDPNRYGAFPLENHTNRAVQSQYTPGSTFKPFLMATVLAQSAARLDEVLDCSEFRYRGRRVHDAHPHGRLSVPEILIHSSNIGMAQLVLRLVPDEGYPEPVVRTAFRRVRDTLSALGFGVPTGVGLPGEAAGLLGPVRRWTAQYTLVSLSFGHEIAVTPLQLAAAFCVFAEKGLYRAPRVVERLVRSDGSEEVSPIRPARRVFDEETAAAVREMLVRVVEEGTGKRAAVRGYRVAGKTSTAQWERDRSHYTASFACFAPAEDPRLLVLVVVDRPRGRYHSGGMVAAPVAGELLARGLAYLRVPPETGQ